jgi:ankyrin repeat protein
MAPKKETSKDVPKLTLELREAIERDKISDVKSLLKKGADINSRDEYGLCALHNAIVWGNEEMVQLLLENGANPKKKDIRGRTPIEISHETEEIMGEMFEEANKNFSGKPVEEKEEDLRMITIMIKKTEKIRNTILKSLESPKLETKSKKKPKKDQKNKEIEM